MLGGIGGQFVERERKPLRGRWLQRNVRPSAMDLVAGPIRRQFFIDESAEIGAAPTRVRQKRMCTRQGFDAALDGLHVIFHAFCARKPDNGLNDGQRIARSMIDLTRKQDLTLVGFLAIGDIDGDAVDTHDLACIVDAGSRRSDAPAHIAIGPHHTELNLLRAGALRHTAGVLNERNPVFRMDQRPDVLDRDLKTNRIDAEYAVLALVPAPLFAD